MARVRDIEIHEVPEDVRGIYKRFSEEYGPFLNQVKVFAHRAPVLKHIQGLLLDLKDEQILDKRYLEIALVVVSKINECTYCVAHHAPRLVEQGLGAETVANILEPDCPGLNDVDRLVRDFAVQVTEKPQYMRDVIFDEMKKHFTEEQIVELTVRTALCGFFNRVNDALQIGMEEGVIEDYLSHGSSTEALPQHDAAE
ncbi:carboxymuconolactone decarboxylase family protein [Limibacillus halophilus]|uniref:Putative peroxidase-related enzyme n=1 Tax=Limibacillus halophilus TaxID=1579333 RepID=A0A839T0A4_9PROT|nr:carboxymuconolactone decarboxylase family protein [Limibacillus halophilus]MBB3066755.1 putative peroxidase-related enzyme [Limibacillus halophilus]